MIDQGTFDRWTPRLLSVLRVVVGLLYIEHGTAKLLHYPYADYLVLKEPLWSLSGVAGFFDSIGGSLIALGLFTRPVALLLSGEMAVAYFLFKAPHGFFPILNGGELPALYCFLYLFFATAGAGPWSLDGLLRRSQRGQTGTS